MSCARAALRAALTPSLELESGCLRLSPRPSLTLTTTTIATALSTAALSTTALAAARAAAALAAAILAI